VSASTPLPPEIGRSEAASSPSPRLRGEGRGEGQPGTSALVSAPHPNPLPTEERGEGTATALLETAVTTLLARSLEAWGVDGEVGCEAGGVLVLAVGGKHLRVSRAPAELPFRWMVDDGARTRGVTSIAGLLRSLRAIVDPDYRPVRLRIAPLLPP
jgi:hypothetical protein